MKHKELLDDLLKKEVLGKVLAYTSMKEDQKRGLPHVHILCIMAADDKPRRPEAIDKVVSAEIPDPDTNPRLHNIVTKYMCHGPCGAVNPAAPCMETTGGVRRCTKDFPKQFQQVTTLKKNGYPHYRRTAPQDGGRTHHVKVKGGDFTIDNSWIVPYSPFLSLKFNCHLNVEVVTSVESVKYIYKYTHKGSDRVVIRLANGEEKDITNDEVERYINARYISASEAYWRLFEFGICHKYPSVEKLPLHLEDEQTVYFQPEDAVSVAHKDPPVTKLTAYFTLNRNSEDTSDILYPDIYQHYTWNAQAKKWVKRKKDMRKFINSENLSDTVGRIPIINLNANQAELYFLRMMLYNKAGATSFADLRTIDGVQLPTFQTACLKLGLLSDDSEINKVIEEAATVRFGRQLREVFSTILIWIRPGDCPAFWEHNQKILCEDLMRRDQVTEPTDQIICEALLDIQEHLERNGQQLKNFDLPTPDPSFLQKQEPREIREETQYDRATLEGIVECNTPLMNSAQQVAYTTVMNSIDGSKGKMIALNAAGGTGKTFLISTILAHVRSMGNIALATATSGIAATLLMNGRTLHSRCKVPVSTLDESSMCNISKRDATAELIRKCKLLVIDEVTMANRAVYETVERSFRDIRESEKVFGGVTVLLSGDWRQILPVVRHGGRADIINACLKSSPLWKKIKVINLLENMRINAAEQNSADFANDLLQIGEGRVEVHEDLGQYKIRVDEEYLLEDETLDGLCNFVWQDLHDNYSDPEWLCSRAVLTPTNKEAEVVNLHMLSQFPGETKEYKSSDKLLDKSHVNQYPVEFLNTLSPSGMAPHLLSLKKGCPIMLLRNLDPSNGHCNGTRYIVTNMHGHVIEATVATGVHIGNRLFIPRIPMRPTDTTFPFEMERRQYPIKVCFGMTSNKSQGQTLEKTGIYEEQDFFSHGQLYVAMSRVQAKKNMKILALNGRYEGKDGVYIDNVVYPEILS